MAQLANNKCTPLGIDLSGTTLQQTPSSMAKMEKLAMITKTNIILDTLLAENLNIGNHLRNTSIRTIQGSPAQSERECNIGSVKQKMSWRKKCQKSLSRISMCGQALERNSASLLYFCVEGRRKTYFQL